MNRLSLPGVLVLCALVSAPVWITACAARKPATTTADDAARLEAERRQRAIEDSIRAAQEAERLAREAEARRLAEEEAARRRAEEEARRKAEDEARRMAMLNTIYFDYDKSNIRDDQRASLDENARKLRDYRPEDNILIEGHCDERGTVEYNLALGERRASSVKKYLVSAGIKDARIETISYGKERPVAMGHDESAWWQNRRAELKRK
jgi:peptidoglycan-associated lipoprotein